MSEHLKNSSGPLAEIVQGPNAFEEFLERNQMNLILLAIVLAIGAAGLVVYRGIKQSAEMTGGAALTKAEDLASLQAVVDENGNTQAGGSAMVLLADKQWTAGQQDVAIATLEKFISSRPNHPAVPSAKASLGAKLMTQGKSAEATKIFQELVDSPTSKFIAPFALISMGDIARTGGDLDKAKADYEKARSNFASSSFAETATNRLANLDAKPPVEIEPPPASAASPAAPGTNPIDAIKAALPPGVTVAPAEIPAPEKPPAPIPAETLPTPKP